MLLRNYSNLRNVLLVALFIFVSLLCNEGTVSANNQNGDPKWRICLDSSQCVVIEGVCYAQEAINIDFKKQAVEHFRLENTAASCVSPENLEHPKYVAICVESICQLKEVEK